MDSSEQPMVSDSRASRSVADPTSVRKRIIAVSVLMAFMLYLDRVCLGEIVKSDSFLNDFKGASREQIGDVLGAFFFAYALFQVPSGWASDRFGGRIMLTFYILAWSLLTGLTGMGTTLGGLLLARLAFGVAQAGAYATSSGVIRNWFHFRARAQASSFVSIGGRLGGTLAPFLTTALVYQLSSWRYVLYLYCLVGLIAAIAYYVIVRNRPEEHAGVNEAELELIGRADGPGAGAAATTNLRDVGPMMVAILKSRSLWLNSLAQFCLVFGWAFLITWLPTFLKEERNVEALLGSLMVTGVLAIAIPGQLIGGWLGNHAVERLGHRWGRIVPLSVTCGVAGLAYLGCLSYQSVWWVVACCALVSLMTDIGNPSVWAFMQDVGGKNTAAVFGWGNMWGNFGAAASSMVVPRLMTLGEASGSGETYVFLTCAGMYFLAAIAVLGTDATRQVRRAD